MRIFHDNPSALVKLGHLPYKEEAKLLSSPSQGRWHRRSAVPDER